MKFFNQSQILLLFESLFRISLIERLKVLFLLFHYLLYFKSVYIIKMKSFSHPCVKFLNAFWSCPSSKTIAGISNMCKDVDLYACESDLECYNFSWIFCGIPGIDNESCIYICGNGCWKVLLYRPCYLEYLPAHKACSF